MEQFFWIYTTGERKNMAPFYYAQPDGTLVRNNVHNTFLPSTVCWVEICVNCQQNAGLSKERLHTESQFSVLGNIEANQGAIIRRSTTLQETTVDVHRMSIIRHAEVGHDCRKRLRAFHICFFPRRGTRTVVVNPVIVNILCYGPRMKLRSLTEKVAALKEVYSRR